MTTYFLSPISTILQLFTDQGVVLAGGKINTYLAGSSTPTTTWTDITGGTPNANPITLLSSGRPPNAIWQQSRVPIKVIITDANNNPLGPTFDQISGVGDPGSSLQSFYGTDAGAANAYVITVSTANFSSYVDGLVIYWTPLNTNTGATTVNVNGLGAISLVYPAGTALGAGAIVANNVVQMMSSGGKFLLLSSGAASSLTSGTFIGTLTGCTTSPTGTFNYVRSSGFTTIYLNSGLTATSNANTLTVTGVPSAAIPSIPQSALCRVTDNGTVQLGVVQPAGSTMTFGLGAAGAPTGFTNSGTKGIPGGFSVTFAS